MPFFGFLYYIGQQPKYDRQNNEFTNWFADDGIGGNQFYDRASCQLSDGRLVFGGTHGLTVFDPKRVTQVREIPLYFEDLKIHNVLIRPGEGECITKALAYDPVIDLKHEQNCFSISFVALEYAEYDKLELYEQLQIVDPTVIVCGYTIQCLNRILPVAVKERAGQSPNLYYWTEINQHPVLILDYWHPSNQYPDFMNYYGLVGAYQQALKDEENRGRL